MHYNLEAINTAVRRNPEAFIRECDLIYEDQIRTAAAMISENTGNSPVVLLAGPSGSGKTTTGIKIAKDLTSRGITSHSISLDNYYREMTPDEVPKTPAGENDLESPLCMDIELLQEHFSAISRGYWIDVPKYDFKLKRRRNVPSKTIRPGGREVLILEGIHALNDMLTDIAPVAFRIYISASSDIYNAEDKLCFKGAWTRFIRRVVRDIQYRSSSAAATVAMWETVLLGERKYILPFTDKANYTLNSSLPYEIPAIKNLALELLKSVPEGPGIYGELKHIIPALELFEDMDPGLVGPESLIREFIGGGSYSY